MSEGKICEGSDEMGAGGGGGGGGKKAAGSHFVDGTDPIYHCDAYAFVSPVVRSGRYENQQTS